MNVHTLDEMRDIYFEICVMVCKMVWKTVCDFIEKEPGFDPSRDNDFKKAIKTIKIYETKRNHLTTKGYK